MDLTSLYRGVTIPLGDIATQIENLGWTLDSVKWKKDSYAAKASNPHGDKIERTGVTDATAAANVLLNILRLHQVRTGAQHYGGMWNTSWADQLDQIAEAYSKAPVFDPKAAGAWRVLASDSVARAKVLGQQLTIKVVPAPEPYKSAAEMSEDIHKNKRFLVSNANSNHPIWSIDENVAFRIVHDVLGHAVSGGDFGWHGENLACAAHFPLLSPVAQQALFTECIGQTAYAAFYRSFGPQKVCFLNEFLDPAQKSENPPAHSGIHPSQSIAPTQMPSVAPSPEPTDIKPEEYVAPHMEGLGLTPVMSKFATTIMDPNQGWSSGASPLPDQDALNDMKVTRPDGQQTDPLDADEVMNNASLIDTKWHQFKLEDGGRDYDKMRQAIVNAFRVVLLSPRKDLRWNAVHYQDIANVPWNETDPKVYWDTLEKSRQEYNVKEMKSYLQRTAPHLSPERINEQAEAIRFSHQAHLKYIPQFMAVLATHRHNLTHDQLKAEASEMMWEWFVQEQDKILAQDENKPEDKKMSGDEVERKANAGMQRRMELYVKDSKPEMDFVDERLDKKPKKDEVRKRLYEEAMGRHEGAKQEVNPDQAGFNLDAPEVPVDKPDRYGAFMGTHLKSIAAISQHADEILKAALEDVEQHDATGHHFRAAVLQLGVSGVGPKVCSFAWLLLQPMTSQLATIDTHMMDVLGHDYEKDMNNRDYFKFERELAAGRDASGYSHVPLGAFQWGMWDHKRTGPLSHQDHSAMSVIDPKPHTSIDWAEKANNLKGQAWAKQGPWWWKNTLGARDNAAQEFDDTTTVPQNQIPFQVQASLKGVTAAVRGARPWLDHGGKLYVGEPNQPYAQFIRRSVNVPAHEFFDSTGYSMGRYDPDTNDVVTVEGSAPDTEELRSLLLN